MLFRPTVLLFSFLLCCFCCHAQNDRVYNFSFKKDGVILTGATASWLTSNYIRSKTEKATQKDVLKLYAQDLWGIDRLAIGNSSESARGLSDKFLYAGLVLPFMTYLDPKVRNEKGAVFGMAMETMLINNAVTNLFKSSAKRYRPYTYRPTTLTEAGGISGTSRESFISGHTSNVAAATFFTAQVLTDLHPDSNLKPLIWTSAAVIPAITGYLRVKAGRHFPTDVIAGYGVGALVGFLVPKWHRIQVGGEDVNINVGAVSEGVGLSMSYKLY